MTRPILWALGVLVGAVLTGGSMNRAVRPGRPRRPGSGGRGGAGRALIRFQRDAGPGPSGPFRAHPQVEGQVLRMLVDTGAALCVFTSEDAQRIGIRFGPRDFTARVATAYGTVPAARVRMREIRLGGIAVWDVEALVLPSGRLATSLLGMSFLRRLRGFEVAAGRMILRG